MHVLTDVGAKIEPKPSYCEKDGLHKDVNLASKRRRLCLRLLGN